MAEKSNKLEPKKPSESESEMAQLVLPNDTNTMGNLFGGILMQWIDLVGSVAAKRHCHQTVVTVSMDRLDFLQPAHVGELVVLKARVNRAFNTSMEVGVKVYTENLKTGERKHTASAYLTMVALNENRRPTAVPPIEASTEEDIRRYHSAENRRRQRMTKT